MKSHQVDGYFSHGQIVSDTPTGLMVTRGMAVSGPPLENASQLLLNQSENEIRGSILRSLKPGLMNLQVRWEMDDDYSQKLLPYNDLTTARAQNPFTRRERQGRYCLYSRKMEEGKLRCPSVSFYLSSPIEGTKGKRVGHLDETLAASARGFEPHLEGIRQSIQRLGGSATMLDELGLFGECYRHFNPSAKRFDEESLKAQFRPDQSIMDNCASSEMVPVVGQDSGFYYDGSYHGFLTVKALPQYTTSGMIAALTSLPFGGYSITLNISALDVNEQIENEERIKARLQKALSSSSRTRMAHRVAACDVRIQKLMSNEVVPFRMQLIVHCRDTSREGLLDKMVALKSAITRMQGAKYYEMANPVTARNYFLTGAPGISFQEKDFHHYIEDHNLANLIPISGEIDSEVEKAEALYHNSGGNLFGVRTFVGGMPQHALVSGWSGGGKSVFVQDILCQTEPYYDYTVILDAGLSHGTYVKTVSEDARTLSIEANGSDTINYLDPTGSPLTSQHLADASAVIHHMLGDAATSLLDAIVDDCLGRFYQIWFERWAAKYPKRVLQVAFSLIQLAQYSGKKVTLSNLDELYQRHREDLKDVQEGALAVVTQSGLTPEQALKDSSKLVKALAVAFMKPDEQAMHSDFHDFLESESSKPSRHQREIGELATHLAAWRAGGKYGQILDGVNTIDLGGRIVHIELGRISDSLPELRNLAGFILTNQVRNQIAFQRPRGERKRIIVEELGGFLEVKGGEKLVVQLFQQMRKHGCWVLGVCQQLSTLPKSLRDTVVGNCRQAFFFKQKYESDARVIQKSFQLPDVTVDALMNFPDPTPELGAPFIYWQNGSGANRITTGLNLVSPEMLYVASSNNKHFEAREKALANYDSVLDGIIAESAKGQTT